MPVRLELEKRMFPAQCSYSSGSLPTLCQGMLVPDSFEDWASGFDSKTKPKLFSLTLFLRARSERRSAPLSPSPQPALQVLEGVHARRLSVIRPCRSSTLAVRISGLTPVSAIFPL